MKRMNKRIRIVLIGVSAIFLLTACGNKKAADKTTNEQSIHIGVRAEISTIDPAKSTDIVSADAIGQVMEGLYRLDKNNQPIPAVAKEKAAVTKDGLHYTFKLRKDAKWSNGEPVTAQDFVYGWQRVVVPKTASEYAHMLSFVENAEAITKGEKAVDSLGIKAVDEHTLKVDLARPMPYFDTLMAFKSFFPQNQKFVEGKGSKFGLNSKNALYNGPFVLKAWDGTGLTWTYAKNPHYWGQKDVKLDKIYAQVIKEPSTALDYYNGKKLDDVILSGETAKQMKKNKDFQIRKLGSAFYMEANQTKNELLKNRKARQAMSLVLDRKQLTNQILGNGSVPVDGLVPPDFAKDPKTGEDFTKETKTKVTKDIKKAQKLWREAQQEAQQEVGFKEVTLNLLSSDTEEHKKTAEYIQGALQDNLKGLKVELSAVPLKVRLDRSTKGDFDLVIGSWTADFFDPISFEDLFVTTGPYNRGKWSNAEYDQLIQDAKVTYANEPEKRWQALLDAHEILMNDQGMIPLYQISEAHLTNPNIKGALYHPTIVEYDYRNAYLQK